MLEDSEILFEVIPEDSNRRVAPSSGGLSEGTGSKGISALATSSVSHGVVDCCVSPFATSRHAPRELWRIFCGFRRLDTLSYGISKHAVKASTVYAFRSSASDSSLVGMRPGNVLVTPMKDHRHTQWHVVVSEQQLGGSASFSRVAKPSAQPASASTGKWPAIIQHHQHATPPRQPPRKPETESIAMDQGLDWCNEDHESLIAEADEIIPQQLHKYSAAMAAAKWEYLDDDLWDTQKRDRPPSVSPLLTHSFPGAESLKQNISLLPTTTDVAEDTHTYWWQAMYDRVSTSVAMWMESIPRVWTRQERHQYHEIT